MLGALSPLILSKSDWLLGNDRQSYTTDPMLSVVETSGRVVNRGKYVHKFHHAFTRSRYKLRLHPISGPDFAAVPCYWIRSMSPNFKGTTL